MMNALKFTKDFVREASIDTGAWMAPARKTETMLGVFKIEHANKGFLAYLDAMDAYGNTAFEVIVDTEKQAEGECQAYYEATVNATLNEAFATDDDNPLVMDGAMARDIHNTLNQYVTARSLAEKMSKLMGEQGVYW